MKRYASPYLLLPEQSECLKQQVVEVEEGIVIRFFPLTEELEDTEWLSGVIVLEQEDSAISTIGALRYRAFHCPRFDITVQQPAAGTPRRRLL